MPRSKFELRRRTFLAQSSALVLGTALGGIPLPVLAQEAIDKPHGGTLTFALSSEPPTLLALTNTDTGATTISPKVVDGLLTFDLDRNPIPQLAQSWEISEDGREYTFHLRPDVRWHDGEPFTARDVAVSLQIARERHARARVALQKITEYVIHDDLTITLKLSAPAPYLLTALIPNEAAIVPAHLFEGEDPILHPANASPIGTGPYRFETWERGNYISLVRNEDYWGADKPYLDRIIFRIIPDATARSVALQNGEIDIAAWNPIPATDLPLIENYPHLAVNRDGYDYRPTPFAIEFNFANPYLKELKVREAFARAIDRNTLLNIVFHGEAVIHDSPVSPFSGPYFKDVEGYGYDPEEAKRLLDEAGFPAGANGIRFSIRLDHRTNRSEYRPFTEYLRAALRQVGIDLVLRGLDNAAWNPLYDAGDWDAHLSVATNMIDPALGIVRYFSSAPETGGVGIHKSGYFNPEVDSLLKQATEENDPETRYRLWHEFQEIAVREAPRLYLLTALNYTVHNTRVRDFALHIDGVRGNFADAYLQD